MRIKHVQAKRGEWVKVHRPGGRSRSDNSGDYGWVIKAAAWVGSAYMALWVFGQIWPFLILAGLGYVVLQIASKR